MGAEVALADFLEAAGLSNGLRNPTKIRFQTNRDQWFGRLEKHQIFAAMYPFHNRQLAGLWGIAKERENAAIG